MKIRKATIADCHALARIQVASYRSAYAGFFPKTYLDRFSYEEETADWQHLLTTERDVVLFVAEDDRGKLVGYALGKVETDPLTGYDGSLTAIHVQRSQQRQGIGRQLLSAVVTALKEQHCRSLWLTTLVDNPAQAWYERLGGTPSGEVRYVVDETEIVEIKYGWSDIGILLLNK